ncbi:hypothetical protein OK18_04675 [Chryseobacterium gallinarum]|uniref:Glyoxalase/fosfomycin resistance/dioxygenase domain-containing protein n=1 Tax=Chryseobacterium gallinarum TaxID=1324352 RepID=A0A0G3LZK3_CHRGL|nr:VOC family protein [Chryseobacterium gallinarum]AKK72024.1 hypothetical protein OK18_04675 [Chryseobacterium gallinarum]
MNARLATIILFVQDLQLLRNFYVENFNLKIIEEDPVWILLDAGSAHMGLHKIGDQYIEKTEADQTFSNNIKIVFDIDTDIESARDELISKKVAMREIKTFENYPFRLCDGTDPEGNVFQLKSKK